MIRSKHSCRIHLCNSFIQIVGKGYLILVLSLTFHIIIDTIGYRILRSICHLKLICLIEGFQILHRHIQHPVYCYIHSGYISVRVDVRAFYLIISPKYFQVILLVPLTCTDDKDLVVLQLRNFLIIIRAIYQKILLG